jgi:hypothetical protein
MARFAHALLARNLRQLAQHPAIDSSPTQRSFLLQIAREVDFDEQLPSLAQMAAINAIRGWATAYGGNQERRD